MNKTNYFKLSVCCLGVIIFFNMHSQQLKILFVLNGFPPKSGRAILNEITGLIDRGCDVRILSSKRARIDNPHPDVEKYNLISKTTYRVKDLNELPFDLDDFDIIYCQFGNIAQRFIDFKRIKNFRAKLVTRFRGADISKHIQGVSDPYVELFKKGDLFLPVCAAFKDKLIQLGCDPQKVIVHHSAINCKKFLFKPHTYNGGTVRLVSVCRLTEKKGLEYAIRAVALLKEKSCKVKYLIVGFGPLEEKLQTLIQKLGMENDIKMFGKASEEQLIQILNKAHIFILPSITAPNGDKEGIPNALKEAMAVGMPVICTAHSGNVELVEHSQSGFLVPEKNSLDLASRVRYLIQHPELWKKIELSARAKIEQEFDMEKVNDILIKNFKNLSIVAKKRNNLNLNDIISFIYSKTKKNN